MRSVYLAAAYPRRDEIAAHAAALSDLGYTITSRWLRGTGPLDSNPEGEQAETAALEDLGDLRRALIAVFTTEPAGSVHQRGGRHVEFGVALELGMRTILVGPPEHVFHWLSDLERYDTWDDLLAQLQRETSWPDNEVPF